MLYFMGAQLRRCMNHHLNWTEWNGPLEMVHGLPADQIALNCLLLSKSEFLNLVEIQLELIKMLQSSNHETIRAELYFSTIFSCWTPCHHNHVHLLKSNWKVSSSIYSYVCQCAMRIHTHTHTHNVWSKHELLLDERGWDNIELLIMISTLTVLWCESSFSVARPNFQSPNRTQRSQSSHVWNGFSLSFADTCVNVCAQATSKRLSVIKCIEPR